MDKNIHLIGNAHLDPAWLWRFDEGFEAFLATCRSALTIMRDTPAFIFTCSSAACYHFVEETDPRLFAEIQEAVHNGSWEIVGGWWIEPDCNIPSGESFVRQALYGQRYFESRFGKKCAVGYCIDSFGHNANLPQILSKSGMDSYVFMRPDQLELPLPGALFRWQAPSGDEVTAYRIPYHYSNYRHTIGEKVEMLKHDPQYLSDVPWMLFYGVGNHGGGPTREQIGEIERLNLLMSRTDHFFERAKKNHERLSIYKGELQHHAIGCYSNHSELKAANRRAEHALLRAEKFAVLSELLTGHLANWQETDRAWKNVLLNQFHDILGGVSTEEVCQDALYLYGEAIAIASRTERVALQRIRNEIDTSDTIESLIVFNPQLQPYSGPVEFELWNPEGSEQGHKLESITLLDSDGNMAPTQRIEPHAKIGPDRARFAALCDIQPYGWKKYILLRTPSSQPLTKLVANERFLRNEKIMFTLDRQPFPNVLFYEPLEVYKDEFDTWAHGATAFTDRVGRFLITDVDIAESGPVRARMRIKSKYGRSLCQQDIILYDKSDELIIETTLDWREPHALCKLSLAHRLDSPRFFFEIPYAVIERPADGKEYPAISWAFANDEMKGLGIISESKSSVSCDSKHISLVVARSPLYAHHVPPHELHEYESLRYLDHGIQRFTTKIVLGRSSHQDAQMALRSLHFHEPPVAVIESSHSGTLGDEYSDGALSGNGIQATVIKPAADKEGVVIRVCETKGEHSRSHLNISMLDSCFNIPLSPYEIKTYRISENRVAEISLIEDNL